MMNKPKGTNPNVMRLSKAGSSLMENMVVSQGKKEKK